MNVINIDNNFYIALRKCITCLNLKAYKRLFGKGLRYFRKKRISMFHLKPGDEAPKQLGLDENGDQINLEAYKGKKVILFFYPRDNTPTCTEEACNLRDNYSSLKKKGYEVIGISTDTAKKHQNFINKHDLPFPLIADTEMNLVNDYGVWGEKKFMGRVYDGIHRTTFVIDEQGKVEHVINKVRAKEHAQQILEELEK